MSHKMRFFYAILLSVSAGLHGVHGQSWTAPAVGIDISAGADGTTAYYMYNLAGDVFMAYGYTWGTRAFATQLWNASDTKQQVYVSRDNGNYRLSVVNMSSANIFCNGAEDIYVDKTTNPTWSLTAGSVNYAYRLQNTSPAFFSSGYMVPATLSGGYIKLSATATNNEWAFIPKSSLSADLALYKAKSVLYNILNEAKTLDATTYAAAISTAATVYNNSSGTAADLIAAAQTLSNAISGSASVGHPLDMTHFIANAGFESFSNTGWSTTGNSGAYGYGVYEMYGSAFTMTQTLTVPNGHYVLTANAFHRPSSSGITDYNVYLKANDKTTRLVSLYDGNEAIKYNKAINNNGNYLNGVADKMISAAEAFSMGAYIGNAVDVIVSDGSLTIGITSTESGQWTLFDNFKLTLYGDPLPILRAEIAEKLIMLTSYSGQVPGNLYGSYSALITDARRVDAETDVDSLQNILDELEAAIEELEFSKEAYASCLSYIPYCENLLENSAPNAISDYNTFYGTVSSARADLDACTTTAAVNRLIDTLKAAFISYAENSSPSNNAIDFTHFLTNPSFETGDFTGWSYTMANNINVGTYSYSGMDGTKAANMWYGFGEGTQYTLSQTLSEMPKGFYKLSAAVNGYTSKKTNGGPSVLSITGNEKRSTVTIADNGDETTNIATAQVIFLVTASNGSFSVGITSKWFYQADNFRLYYYGQESPGYTAALATAKSYAAQITFEEVEEQLKQAIEDVPASYSEYEIKTEKLNAVNALAANARIIIDNGYDATSLVTNPTMESAGGWNTSLYGNSWNAVTNFSLPYIEKWVSSQSGSLASLGDFTAYQSLVNMPAGNYTFSAYCIATQQGNSGEACKTGVSGVKLFANLESTEVATLNETVGVKYSVSVTLKAGEELKIGLCGVGCTANWVAWDNLTLTYGKNEEEEEKGSISGAIEQEAINAIQATLDLNRFCSVQMTNATGESLSIGNSANPNLIVIDAPAGSMVSNAISAIRNGDNCSFDASITTLTDEKPFFSPVAITGNLEYRRVFKGVLPSDAGGWSVLSLPFAPTSVTANISGISYNFYPYPVWAAQNEARKETTGFYWIKQTGNSESATADAINRNITAISAHTPYIIAFPYYSALAEDYPQLGIDYTNGAEFTFSGSGIDATVESGVSMCNYAFNPAFSGKEATDAYYLNSTGDAFVKVDGISTTTAFRPYITGTASGIQSRRFNIGGGNDITAIDRFVADVTAKYLHIVVQRETIEIYAEKEALALIYRTDGRLFGRIQLQAGEKKSIPVSAGIYIVNKQRIIVK